MFLYSYQSHLVLCYVIYNKLPVLLRAENKWAIFLGEVTKTKSQVINNVDQAQKIISNNNQSTVTVMKSLLKHATVKSGFFESLHLSLTYLNKISLEGLKEILSKHGI